MQACVGLQSPACTLYAVAYPRHLYRNSLLAYLNASRIAAVTHIFPAMGFVSAVPCSCQFRHFVFKEFPGYDPHDLCDIADHGYSGGCILGFQPLVRRRLCKFVHEVLFSVVLVDVVIKSNRVFRTSFYFN
jgi:hypothetical protein